MFMYICISPAMSEAMDKEVCSAYIHIHIDIFEYMNVIHIYSYMYTYI